MSRRRRRRHDLQRDLKRAESKPAEHALSSKRSIPNRLAAAALLLMLMPGLADAGNAAIVAGWPSPQRAAVTPSACKIPVITKASLLPINYKAASVTRFGEDLESRQRLFSYDELRLALDNDGAADTLRGAQAPAMHSAPVDSIAHARLYLRLMEVPGAHWLLAGLMGPESASSVNAENARAGANNIRNRRWRVYGHRVGPLAEADANRGAQGLETTRLVAFGSSPDPSAASMVDVALGGVHDRGLQIYTLRCMACHAQPTPVEQSATAAGSDAPVALTNAQAAVDDASLVLASRRLTAGPGSMDVGEREELMRYLVAHSGYRNRGERSIWDVAMRLETALGDSGR